MAGTGKSRQRPKNPALVLFSLSSGPLRYGAYKQGAHCKYVCKQPSPPCEQCCRRVRFRSFWGLSIHRVMYIIGTGTVAMSSRGTVFHDAKKWPAAFLLSLRGLVLVGLRKAHVFMNQD